MLSSSLRSNHIVCIIIECLYKHFSIYIDRILSIAYVRGLTLAMICSQYGMNDNGAKAVLENNIGRLIININAKNSICPGKINARQILILDVLKVIKKVINNIMDIFIIFIIVGNIIILHIIIIKVCSIVIVVINSTVDINKESRDLKGEIKSLFKKPNSLSNIRGNPALIDPVKAVKIIIPGLKKFPYFVLEVNKPTGAF